MSEASDHLRRQAGNLLVLATLARESGNVTLADELIARAIEHFEQAEALEAAAGGNPPAPEQSRPTAQLQQQTQAKKDEDESE